MIRLAAFSILLIAFAATADEPKPGEWIEPVGTDLAKNCTTKGNWSLKDGVITLTPRKGDAGWSRFHDYLWLKQTFTDFECEFEYKVEKDGNSGFYFRVGDVANPVNKGIEVQLFASGEKAKDKKLTDHDSGGVIPGLPPSKNAAKPAGEWNKMQVTNKGDKLTVVLNGVTVNEVNLAEGKLKDRPRTGSIGFQDHALPLALRNIKIREIK